MRGGAGYVRVHKSDLKVVRNIDGRKIFEAIVDDGVVRFGSGILFCLFDGDINQWD
jgi:hypothetical protein